MTGPRSPRNENDLLGLLNVHVIGIKVVSLAGATDVKPRVLRTSSEDEQAEEADGEATLQRSAVKDVARVHQHIAMVISQNSGLLGFTQVLSIEPHDRLNLEHRKPRSRSGNWEAN